MKTCDLCGDLCGEQKPLKRDTHQGKRLGMLCKRCRDFMRDFMKFVDHDPAKIHRILDYKFPGWDDTTVTE